jgi:tetratricopeptide (TPR) repeat protein/class 3 adenylate cyclase
MLTEAKRVHKTFLFTDVVKSTDIRAACFREFGDTGNEHYDNQVLVPHDEILDSLTAEFNGEVVSTGGDSYFVAFNSAQSAVQCAVAIQSAFIKKKISLPVVEPNLPPYIQIRIGLHTGGARELLRAGKPNYSDHTINIAARIESLANGEQVLMSEDTWNNAGRLNGITKQEWKGYKLKGVDGTWTLVEALWEERHSYPPQVSPAITPLTSVATIEAFNVFGGRVEIVTDELLSHPASPKRIQQFYTGAKLDWDIIAAHGDIPRDQHEELLKQASQPFQEMQLICIVAEAGAGKSTSAWRIAAELHKQHQALVIRIKDSDDADMWYRLPEFCAKVGRPFYVLVDDIFHNPDAASAFHELKPWLPVMVLATSRPNEYRASRLKCETSRLDLKQPSLSEKERILKKLGKSRSDLTAEQQRRLDAANQFLVLMIELTEGKELREIVRDTVERLYELDEAAYRAYEYLCLVYQHSVAMPISLLERLDRDGRFHNLPERETAQGLIFWDSRERHVRVGHPVIAETAAKFYAQRHAPQAVLEEIAAAVDMISLDERRFLAFLLLVTARRNSPLLASMPKPLGSMIARYVQSAERISELNIWRALYRQLGQPEHAERCMELMLVLEPVSSWDCNFLVNLFRERGRHHEALPIIAKWVKNHPEWGGAGLTYMRLTERYGTANDIERVLQEINLWLAAHADDTYVRGPFLGLVERKGIPEQVAKVVTETSEWLASHPDDSNVRTSYLGLVERKGTSEQVAQVVTEISKWLASHADDSAVRVAYLGLVERKGTSEQVAQVVTEISKWLAAHADDTYVRGPFLGLVERKGIPEQVAKVVTETSEWLASHPDDNHVRTAYLGLVERKGTRNQVAKVVAEISKWLAEPRHQDNISVRERYLGLVEHKGTTNQVAQVVKETSEWLASHPDDSNVRTSYLGLVERKGTSEQVTQVVTETSKWLAEPRHQYNIAVRECYLGFVEASGSTDLKEAVITDAKAWLIDHESAKEIWSALLAWLFRADRSDEAIELALTAISHHPNDAHLLMHYLRAVQNSADEQTIRSVYEQLINKYPKNNNVQVHYAAWLRDHDCHDEAEQRYRNLIAKVPRSFSAHYGYGMLLLKLERCDEAAAQFREVLRIHRGHKMAHDGLAWALWKLGDFERAEREFGNAIYWAGRIGEPQGRFYADLGWFYLDRIRWRDALYAFESARDEDPEYFGNYWGIGRTLYEMGDYAAAADALRLALEKDPDLQPPASEEISQLLHDILHRLSENQAGEQRSS